MWMTQNTLEGQHRAILLKIEKLFLGHSTTANETPLDNTALNKAWQYGRQWCADSYSH